MGCKGSQVQILSPRPLVTSPCARAGPLGAGQSAPIRSRRRPTQSRSARLASSLVIIVRRASKGNPEHPVAVRCRTDRHPSRNAAGPPLSFHRPNDLLALQPSIRRRAGEWWVEGKGHRAAKRARLARRARRSRTPAHSISTVRLLYGSVTSTTSRPSPVSVFVAGLQPLLEIFPPTAKVPVSLPVTRK